MIDELFNEWLDSIPEGSPMRIHIQSNTQLAIAYAAFQAGQATTTEEERICTACGARYQKADWDLLREAQELVTELKPTITGDLIEKIKKYIKGHSNSGVWHNDPQAYALMQEIEALQGGQR